MRDATLARQADTAPNVALDAGSVGAAAAAADAPVTAGRRNIPAIPSVLAQLVVLDAAPQRRPELIEVAQRMGWISRTQAERAPRHGSDVASSESGRSAVLTYLTGLIGRDRLQEAVAVVPVALYVEERSRAHPALLGWLRDAASKGFCVSLHPVDLRELSELRQRCANAAAASPGGAGEAAQGEEGAGKTGDADSLTTLQAARDMLLQGAALGASDLHVLMREDHAEIQYRVKGAMRTAMQLTREDGEARVRALYTGLSSVKEAVYNPYDFQDAQISGSDLQGSGLSSVRIIRGPAYPVESGGSFLVARLQYMRKSDNADSSELADLVRRSTLTLKTPRAPQGKLPLAAMGYTDKQVTMLERMTRMPSGVVIVTGPTGSGKTTTLYELMKHQARRFPESRQITIENPVEYPMDWAVQLPVTKASKVTFADMVRMTLRMDPDIVLVGELRAADECVAALQEAMTGHMVWATLHVNDPFMTVDRMEMLDRAQLARQIICDHKLLRGFVAQRLVPILCKHCKQPLASVLHDLPQDMPEALATWGETDKVFVRGAGCSHCDHQGITGITAVAEVVETSVELMRDLVKMGTDEARRLHRQRPTADRSMLENAMARVFSGEFDPRDVERCVDIITLKGEHN